MEGPGTEDQQKGRERQGEPRRQRACLLVSAPRHRPRPRPPSLPSSTVHPHPSPHTSPQGILNDTLETPNEILKRVLPPRLHTRLAYLSGPSFAAEVAKEHPTAVTIAAEDDGVAKRVQVQRGAGRVKLVSVWHRVAARLSACLAAAH